jgi:osmotically-inducible protein OsmY
MPQERRSSDRFQAASPAESHKTRDDGSLTGPVSYLDTQHAGGSLMPQDLELEEKVREALARDPRIGHHKAIAVCASAGVVTLRGTVESPKQRHAAVEAGRAVTGVEEVYEGLDVRPFPHDPRDDELRGAALQSLIWDERLHAHQIDVDVADAWVTLKGEVKHQHESDAAFEDVSKLDDVGGITNAIKVVTAPSLG